MEETTLNNAEITIIVDALTKYESDPQIVNAEALRKTALLKILKEQERRNFNF